MKIFWSPLLALFASFALFDSFALLGPKKKLRFHGYLCNYKSTVTIILVLLYYSFCPTASYLLGLLAMIKCSICSYQCDNWYSSNRKIACHANFSLGRLFLELARGHLTCCPGIALSQVRHTLRGNNNIFDQILENWECSVLPHLGLDSPGHRLVVATSTADVRSEIILKEILIINSPWALSCYLSSLIFFPWGPWKMSTTLA